MANSNNNPQSVIPDVVYDVEGDFVTVPVPEGADAGKVLGAISEGHVGWVEDQGGGTVQQQSDWTETDDTKVTFIQHKPANLVQDAAYVHTDNNFTDADSTKLAGIAAGAEVNVQSSWTESDTSSDAYIANKPTQKPVVAGANISIVDGQDAVTISATVPTVDQTYSASSTNAQSGVAVAEAVGGVAAVPSVTSTDDGKVLKASYDSVAGTGSFSWETQTNPTVDQVYDSASANAQSGVAVAGAIASVNQVPSSTSSDANKVLTVDAQGVPGWATASGGGGDGIKQIYPQSVASDSNDKSLRVLNCNAFGLKYPAEGDAFSFRILTYGSFSTDSIPMYGMYYDKMYMHGASSITLATKYYYPFDGVYYAWFPCTGYITDTLTPISKDIYLKSKTTIVFSSSSIHTTAYRTDGTIYSGSGSDALKYRKSIKTPFSETPSLELYAEDFDLIGDWSTVSTLPKLEWTLAFMTPGGAWTRLNGQPTTSELSSALAARIPAGLSLALQSGSGLELNPVTGLKVLNKLPSSASTDEGKVLTVDSQGAAAWSTLPSDVPAYSDADSGKVLQVQADGTLAWVTLP